MANKDIISASIDLIGGLFKLSRAIKEYMSLPSQDEIDRMKKFRLYTINYKGRINARRKCK